MVNFDFSPHSRNPLLPIMKAENMLARKIGNVTHHCVHSYLVLTLVISLWKDIFLSESFVLLLSFEFLFTFVPQFLNKLLQLRFGFSNIRNVKKTLLSAFRIVKNGFLAHNNKNQATTKHTVCSQKKNHKSVNPYFQLNALL